MQDFSPLELLEDPELGRREVQIWMKRDDLVEGPGQGNKFRKLKYQLEDAKRLHAKTLVTFGGAYSNHLFAVAGMGRSSGFDTVGYIRSASVPRNPTTTQLRKWGMKLIPLDRGSYRKRESISFLHELKEKHERAYLLPEGGSAPLALPGIRDMVREIREQCPLPVDYFACPVGTGATVAGIAAAIVDQEKVLGCLVLKGLQPLHMIRRFLPHHEASTCFFEEAHYGKFAKCPPNVQHFIHHFYEAHGICLDPLYTGKMMKRLYELIDECRFPRGTVIAAIHTGGLQGTVGFNERFGTNLPLPRVYQDDYVGK